MGQLEPLDFQLAGLLPLAAPHCLSPATLGQLLGSAGAALAADLRLTARTHPDSRSPQQGRQPEGWVTGPLQGDVSWDKAHR